MVGRAALLGCLRHPKLTGVLVADFTDISSAREQLRGYDACFFCAGVSSVGMNEEEYTRLTYTLAPS